MTDQTQTTEKRSSAPRCVYCTRGVFGMDASAAGRLRSRILAARRLSAAVDGPRHDQTNAVVRSAGDRLWGPISAVPT
jgi:hypothetical protein